MDVTKNTTPNLALLCEEESQTPASLNHSNDIRREVSRDEGLTLDSPRSGGSVRKSILKLESDAWRRVHSFDSRMTRGVSFAGSPSVLLYDRKDDDDDDDAKNETCCAQLECGNSAKCTRRISSRSEDSVGRRITRSGGCSTKGNRPSVASDYMTSTSMEFAELFGCSTGNSSHDNPIVTSSRRPSVYSSKSMEERRPSGITSPATKYTAPNQAKKGTTTTTTTASRGEDLLSFYGKKYPS